MIKIKVVDEKTYDLFLENAVKLYAAESVAAGRWEVDEAIELARKESEKFLPEKHKTAGNYLYNIMDDSNVVGYIWSGCNDPKKQEAFIYAFEVFKEYRGKAYGKKGFLLVEEDLTTPILD